MSHFWVAVLCLIGFKKSDAFMQWMMRMITSTSGDASLFLKDLGLTDNDRQKEDRETLNLACEFYKQPNSRVSNVMLTKLVDFENIVSKFQVNIRLYKSVNNSAWKLVFGQHRRSLPNIDLGLYERNCFYIKDLNVLANHWECVGCQQRFSPS